MSMQARDFLKHNARVHLLTVDGRDRVGTVVFCDLSGIGLSMANGDGLFFPWQSVDHAILLDGAL